MGLSPCSQRWLKRQASDPYVFLSHKEGYRARSAYKLLQIVQKHPFLKPGRAVLDVGAAPGSWCQVAARLLGERGTVVGVDLRPISPIPGVTTLQGDMLDPAVQDRILAVCPAFDWVLCDAAPPISGNRTVYVGHAEHFLDELLDIMPLFLKNGGGFVFKTFLSQSHLEWKKRLSMFERVGLEKPKASRNESSEIYLVCHGFTRPVILG